MMASTAEATVQVFLDLVVLQFLKSVGKLVPLIRLGDGQLLSHVVHPDLPEVVAGGNVEPALGPSHPVQGSSSLHRHAGTRHLGVLVEVPQVKPASAVDSRKEGWVDWGPGGVVHVVAVVFERVQGLVLLQTPQFDCPVD